MENLTETVNHFKNNEIVIYPTDTVWGIGCLISNLESINRLSKIKNRDQKPFTVLVTSIRMALRYGEMNDLALKLARNFWPGGLTIIVHFKEEAKVELATTYSFFTETAEELTTIALRVPKHPFLIEVIDSLNEGIVGPSANFKGDSAPENLNHVDPKLRLQADFVVESDFAGSGSNSTIVSTVENHLQILREGEIPTNQLIKVAKQS